MYYSTATHGTLPSFFFFFSGDRLPIFANAFHPRSWRKSPTHQPPGPKKLNTCCVYERGSKLKKAQQTCSSSPLYIEILSTHTATRASSETSAGESSKCIRCYQPKKRGGLFERRRTGRGETLDFRGERSRSRKSVLWRFYAQKYMGIGGSHSVQVQ